MRRHRLKWFFILFLGLLLGIYFYLDLGDLITLEKLKQSQMQIINIYQANPVSLLLVYLLIYICLAALSVPAGIVLTLAAGSIFGFIMGLIMASLGATVGATLAFWGSRYILRDKIEKKFSQQVIRVNEGIEKEGGLFLFSLRVIPAFPYVMVNTLMGLTQISTRKYFLISWLGMLPATATYVYAGTELSQIENTSEIFNLNLLMAFALLGVLPIAFKYLIKKRIRLR